MRPSAWRGAAVLACALLGGCGGGAAAADLPDPWTELAADGSLSLRALVPAGAECPTMTADGAALSVTEGAAPDAAFPVQLCRALAPATAARLLAGGVVAPALAAPVRRVVVLGDTGCRIKGTFVQMCNDPAAWRFAAIARSAALQRPDLVIHVGDYHYRESPCPPGQPGCAGSPWGDNWAVWDADFFSPAAPLLAVVPWVMVRGNHELCGRGGLGWFRLLDPHSGQLDCPAATAPYALHLEPLELIVFDSADADDDHAPPTKVEQYRAQLAPVLADAPPHSWLLTHRPIWALAEGGFAPPGATLNATQQAAIDGQVPDALDLVVSGHVHDFALYDYGVSRPAQLVVGDGGDANDAITTPPAPGTLIDGLPILAAYAVRDYGYLVLDWADGSWEGTVRGADDRVIARCRLAGRSPSCLPAE